MAAIPIALLRSGLGALFLGLITYTGTIVKAQEKVIRIGNQKSGGLLLVKNEGTLETRLAPLGYSVEWREFPSGPPLLEALNAGSLDLGHSGDAPLIFAPEMIDEQQEAADTFFRLGVIPKNIHVADNVYHAE